MKNTAQIIIIVATLSACTKQLPGTFRYSQEEENFAVSSDINTTVDLLMVIDNSSSMDVAQKALRDKLRSFADKYLSPSWDIRIGVITTDTYLANPVFQNYINRTLPGTQGYKSKHLSELIASRVVAGKTTTNDSKLATLAGMNVSLTNSATTAGVFQNGITFGDLVPAWKRGTDYAKLLAGIHDGPVSGLCVERLPYFIADDDQVNFPLVLGPQCKIRDSSDTGGNSKCLSPADGENSVSQCVNTALNDSVRSGSPVIETKMPSTTTDTGAWIVELSQKFMINASVGSAGSGSERGLGSLIEFLNVNEKTSSAFFRAGSLRGIIFLSDEDDQTISLPSITEDLSSFSPETNYQCDLNALVAANTSKFGSAAAARQFIESDYQYCCTNGCYMQDLGCPSKIVEGQEIKVGVCPAQNKFQDVGEIKSQVDQFFGSLDRNTVTAGSYFVAAIVPTKIATINNMQAARYQSDDRIDFLPFYRNGNIVTQTRLRIPAVDEGTRYKSFSSAVGNGSLTMDMGESDYSAILDKIGDTILSKKSRFPLRYTPTSKDEMIVKILHSNGVAEALTAEQYDFEGATLVLKDVDLVLALTDSDKLIVNYQPASHN